MRHSLSQDVLADRLGPTTAGAVNAIERCVHCGFCLATCPTYAETADEAESPRGRIVLMKAALEGQVDVDSVAPHIDSCLGCLACETSCPSGVEYSNLLTPFRELLEGERRTDQQRSRTRRMFLDILESPRKLLWMSRLGWIGRPFEQLLPSRLRPALGVLPAHWPRSPRLAKETRAKGSRRARVLFFRSCVQRVVESQVDHATVEVLAECGVEVVVLQAMKCCGALSAHVGEVERARRRAEWNLAELERIQADSEFDAILTNVAGCGSGLAEYPSWLAGSQQEEPANAMAARAMDVTVFLDQLGTFSASGFEQETGVVLQDACHLRHAQQVFDAPRRLINQIPGLTLLEAKEPEICCGSAGLYSLERPAMAERLGRRKARKLAEAEPDVVVSGNVGCIVQLRRHLEDFTKKNADLQSRAPSDESHSDPLLRLEVLEGLAHNVSKPTGGAARSPRVMHIMELLRAAIRGESIS